MCNLLYHLLWWNISNRLQRRKGRRISTLKHQSNSTKIQYFIITILSTLMGWWNSNVWGIFCGLNPQEAGPGFTLLLWLLFGTEAGKKTKNWSCFLQNRHINMNQNVHIQSNNVMQRDYPFVLRVLAAVWPRSPELWHADAYLTLYHICRMTKDHT